MVVSVDSMGKLSLSIVAPLTEWDPRFAAYPWFVEIKPNESNGLDKRDGVDCFQVKSMSHERFVQKIGVLSSAQMEAIVFAIRLCIGG